MRRRDVLRIGRERAEHWAWAGTRLELGREHVLAGRGGGEAALEAELRAWLQPLAGRAPTRTVDVVLESAWLPVMLLELGRGLCSRSQAENLMRHRLAQLYANPGEPASPWQLQLDHRVGDGQAMGYGLAPTVRQAVLGALAAAGLRAASMQPAFAWAWRRFERRRSLRQGWWTWIEQDRAMVCRIERGRVTAMNAGAAVPADDEQAARLVAIEAARIGMAQPGASAVDEAVTLGWHDLAGPGTPVPTPWADRSKLMP
jgi:hypothetical protein